MRKSPKFRSKFEARVAAALGKGWLYEATKLTYTLTNRYSPDFKKGIGEPDGYRDGTVFIEAKGRFTGTDRRKMLAVKAQHPRADIRLVFMRDNPLYKGAKSKYSDWCKKHNFPFSIFPRLPIP